MTGNYDLLRSLVGGRVRRLGLLVWPDPDGLRNTDVQLHLDIDCVDGASREITCRTGADGQTLKVDKEHWEEGLPLSTLDDRIKAWSSPEFWSGSTEQAYELFETARERSLGVGQGAVVTGVNLIRFQKDDVDPTGVVMEFDSKVRLWSAPHAHGNFVSQNSTDFSWPEEIEVTSIV